MKRRLKQWYDYLTYYFPRRVHHFFYWGWKMRKVEWYDWTYGVNMLADFLDYMRSHEGCTVSWERHCKHMAICSHLLRRIAEERYYFNCRSYRDWERNAPYSVDYKRKEYLKEQDEKLLIKYLSLYQYWWD